MNESNNNMESIRGKIMPIGPTQSLILWAMVLTPWSLIIVALMYAFGG